MIDSKTLWKWIDAIRLDPRERKEVIIKMLDESREEVQAWKLRKTAPMKYTGPTFAAKGGGDVAMEELVLSVEKIELI